MEPPKCWVCTRDYAMIEIGDIGGVVQECNPDGSIAGVHPKKLYQCPNCKVVAIQ